MDSDNSHKLIARYFENDLSDKELATFQQQLREDPAFASAFQMEKDLMEGIESFGNQQLRGQLEAIHLEETAKRNASNENGLPRDENENRGKVVKLVSRRWWWAAAIILVGLVARLSFSDKKPTPQQLYAMYAVHDFDFTVKGTEDKLLSNLESLLKAGKYAQALPLLDTYLQLNPTDLEKMLAKGISLLEMGEHKEAMEIFRAVRQASPIMESKSNWYIALAFLKNGDVENCKKALLTIPAESVSFKDAEELLARLK